MDTLGLPDSEPVGLPSEVNTVDVSDVHSEPRVVRAAERRGLVGGSSMDVTPVDEQGRPWDFDKLEMREPRLLEDHQGTTLLASGFNILRPVA